MLRGMLRVDKMERCCFFRLGQTPGSIFSPPGQRKPGVVGDDLTTMTERTCATTQRNTHDISLQPPAHLTHPPLCNRANIDTDQSHHIQYRTISTQNKTGCPHLLIHPYCIPYPLLLRAFFAARTPRSSLSVTHTQNQLNVSTKANAKNTRFLSPSPPHADAAYPAGGCACADGCCSRPAAPPAPGVHTGVYSGDEGEKMKV